MEANNVEFVNISVMQTKRTRTIQGFRLLYVSSTFPSVSTGPNGYNRFAFVQTLHVRKAGRKLGHSGVL